MYMQNRLTDIENKLVVARGGGLRVCKMGDGGQKIQTSNYKINVMGTAW